MTCQHCESGLPCDVCGRMVASKDGEAFAALREMARTSSAEVSHSGVCFWIWVTQTGGDQNGYSGNDLAETILRAAKAHGVSK